MKRRSLNVLKEWHRGLSVATIARRKGLRKATVYAIIRRVRNAAKPIGR